MIKNYNLIILFCSVLLISCKNNSKQSLDKDKDTIQTIVENKIYDEVENKRQSADYIFQNEFLGKFKKTSLPYFSKPDFQNIQFECEVLKDVDVQAFGQYVEDKEFGIFDIYYYYHYFNFDNDLWGVSFVVFPQEGTTEFEGVREEIFIFKDKNFITSTKLYSSEGVFGETIAKIFVNHENRICISRERTAFYREMGHYFEMENTIDFQYLKSDGKFETTEPEIVLDTSSYEYFYALSTQKKQIPLNLIDYIVFFQDSEEIATLDYEKLSIQPIAHYLFFDYSSSFLFYITDSMTNIIVYNKFDKQGKIIENKIIEDCLAATCSNFEFSPINVDLELWYEISYQHSAGKYKNFQYFHDTGSKIITFYTSEIDYENLKDSEYKEFYYRLINDLDLLNSYFEISTQDLIIELESTPNENEALKLNIDRIKYYLE